MTIRDAGLGIRIEGLSQALSGLARVRDSLDGIPRTLDIGVRFNTSDVEKTWSALRAGQPKRMDQSEIDQIFGTTSATQTRLGKLTEGLEKVNTLLGRNVFHTQNIQKLSTGITTLSKNVGAGAEGAGALEAGFGLVETVGVAAFAAVGLSVADVTGYIGDATGKAAEFRSEMGEISRSMLMNQEQSNALSKSTLNLSLNTGKSTEEISKVVYATLEAGGGKVGGEVNQQLVDLVATRSVQATKSLPGTEGSAVAELMSRNIQFLKSSNEDMTDFVKKSSNAIILSHSLFGATSDEQSAYLTRLSSTVQSLRGNIEERGGSLTTGAGLELSGLAAAAGEKLPGRQGAMRMTELFSQLLTVDEGKRAELGNLMHISGEEFAKRQQDPTKLVLDFLRQYKENEAERGFMRGVIGEESGGTLDVLAPQFDEISKSLEKYNQKLNEGDVTFENFKTAQNGYSYQVEELYTNLGLVSTSLGLIFLPSIIEFVKMLNSVLKPFAEWAIGAQDDPNVKTLTSIYTKLVLFGPLFGAIGDSLKMLVDISGGAYNVLQGFSDWFNGILNTLASLWSYFTGSYSDEQARAYQNAIDPQKMELLRPELIGKTLVEVKAEMPTFSKDLRELPAKMADAVKDAAGLGRSDQTGLAGSITEWTKTNDVSKYTDQQLSDKSMALAKQNYPNREEADLKDVKNDIYDYLKETRDFPDKTHDTQKLNQHTTFEVGGSYNPTVKLPLSVSKENEAGYTALAESPEYSPGFATGGIVKKSGLALVHAGEPIVPAEIARSPRSILDFLNLSSTTDNSKSNVTNNFECNFHISGEVKSDNFELRSIIEKMIADGIQHSQAY